MAGPRAGHLPQRYRAAIKGAAIDPLGSQSRPFLPVSICVFCG